MRTFVLIKKDGINRGLVGEIISRLESLGLQLVEMKMDNLTESDLKKFYKEESEMYPT